MNKISTVFWDDGLHVYIMLYNSDTLGADVSPGAIGHHIIHTNALTFEVIPRRIEDRGHGQEDIYPVAQIEKLWGDMSALSDLQCGYLVVPRLRGQQMKDPAQLDGWVTDGSKDYIEGLCEF